MDYREYLLKEDDDEEEKGTSKKIPEEEVLTFFKENPNPTDDDLHDWAEEQGYNIHKVEEIVYTFATKFVKFSTGGRSNEKGITEKDVNPKELKMGMNVEKEHTDCEDCAKKIALDHLAELKDYYTRLKKMEGEP